MPVEYAGVSLYVGVIENMENKQNTMDCPNQACINVKEGFAKQKTQLYDLQEIKKSHVAQIEKINGEKVELGASLNRIKMESAFVNQGGKKEYFDDYIKLTKGESLGWDELELKDFKNRWSNMFDNNKSPVKSSVSLVSGEAGNETVEKKGLQVIDNIEVEGELIN